MLLRFELDEYFRRVNARLDSIQEEYQNNPSPVLVSEYNSIIVALNECIEKIQDIESRTIK